MDNFRFARTNICENYSLNDSVLKEEFHMEYKNYRNLLSTPMKKSKHNDHNIFFNLNGTKLRTL